MSVNHPDNRHEAAKPGTVPIAWRPTAEIINQSNIGRLMREQGCPDYPSLYRWSCERQEEFWRVMLDKLQLRFATPPMRILGRPDRPQAPEWLQGSIYNITESCFNAPTDRIALISGAEDSDDLRRLSYGELERLVNRIASGLTERFWPGDRIGIYMPLIPEAIAIYLGIIRAGMAAVSIADSFSPEELQSRLRIAGARCLITVDSYRHGGKDLRIYEKVCAAQPPEVFVVNPGHLEWGHHDFADLLGDEHFESVRSGPETITNILFSSGTTREPKAIPWTQVTPIKAAADGWLHHDIHETDVVTWTTGMGWMMAPWLIYASLMNRAAFAIYSGSPATAAYARFIESSGVTILGTIPSLVRSWRVGATMEGHLDKVRLFSSTGEPSNAEDYLYLMSLAGGRAPIIEYCGGTEIGGGYLTGSITLPAAPGMFNTPTLGTRLAILDADVQPVVSGGAGEVFIIPPALGMSETLLNLDHAEEYYAGTPQQNGVPLRRHGDGYQLITDQDSGLTFYRSIGRTDDAMNIGGIKVSAVEIEETIKEHPAITDCAAVAIQPEGGGPERLVIYYTSAAQMEKNLLLAELRQIIATRLNPLFRIHDLVPIETLPRTASNKLIRRKLRGIG
jgi:acetyl-CoA synthetase